MSQSENLNPQQTKIVKFGTGQSWESQSTPQMKMQAAKEFAHPPPSITRKVQHTLREIEYLITHALDQAGIQEDIISEQLLECRTRQLWKESDYTSFGAWVTGNWGKSERWAYKLMEAFVKIPSAQEVQKEDLTLPDNQRVTSKNTPLSNKVVSLDNEEEDEKPAVRAATPEQMKRVEPQGPRSEVGPTGKPSENGKPKHSLAIWKELSETHFGRALNRIDELNRQCPNPKYHAALIEAGKKCLAILEQWRQEAG